ncbi:peptidoglycan editing factor PgeF [Thalassotalea psychrophila]|uniref:Purine nucleoside phosphorylase n=1 Tax=Thalassotalea psychrophila TaxID=3065647 RepID=A0ABY9TX24_9GAMM|nr:peptidoglycan editing factor PgeF [Colwelliaceae bacterium SQ149]
MSDSSVKSAILNIDLPTHENVLAITTTRNNGFSSVPFDSFNLGDHVSDNEQCVILNRKKLSHSLPKNCNIQWLNQVHGSNVIDVKSYSSTPLTADASYTDKCNLALAILTADCLPILLVNNSCSEIAAIHGGWRPVADNIIANTVKLFKDCPENITAWLGPCIGEQAFEVGSEVKQKFEKLSPLFSKAFVKQSNEKFFAKLHLIATLQLQQLGIKNVTGLGECTYSNPDKYFSYRRDGQTGRMASIICITP